MSANSYSNQGQHTEPRLRMRRGFTFGAIILLALIMFEIFNYSTTEFALTDLLGNLSFMGIPWATILALAFCGIDFAGIARLHTPEDGYGQPSETWYLFGAWLLGATMNAMLTWWGVSLAIAHQSSAGDILVDQQTLLRVVPIFVAVLVWLIRVLIIGTYSIAGTRLLSQRDFNRKNWRWGNKQQSSNYRSLGVPQSSSMTAAPTKTGYGYSRSSNNNQNRSYQFSSHSGNNHPGYSSFNANQGQPASQNAPVRRNYKSKP